MAGTILLAPNGEPRRIPHSEIKTFIANGYRRPDPEAVSIAPSVAPIGLERVNVNTDSATKIAKALAGVGTATVKAIVASRPYDAIEDLIDRVPLPNGANWTSYASQLEFDDRAAD